MTSQFDVSSIPFGNKTGVLVSRSCKQFQRKERIYYLLLVSTGIYVLRGGGLWDMQVRVSWEDDGDCNVGKMRGRV